LAAKRAGSLDADPSYVKIRTYFSQAFCECMSNATLHRGTTLPEVCPYQ
jgi:hypothetical protein